MTFSQDALDQARSIVANMSLAAKIGQMSQIDISQIIYKTDDGAIRPNHTQIRHYFGDLAVGSVLNCPNNENGPQWNATEYREVVTAIRRVTDEHGLPPVIWGLDSVHGANYVRNAIMTPQQINMAATFNATVSYEAGRIASKDTRAAGITWLFSPILGLALQPYWSRVYETFGEDPLVASTMGAQLIRGIQDVQDDENDAVPSKAAACAKHFIGYSMPRTGHDRSPAWIPKRHLYQYFVPPWRKAIEDAGVLTVMESYSETDGVPNVANFETTRKLLREELGFDGVLVTDYHEILNLVDWHRIASEGYEAVKLMLRDSSVDMSMIPVDAEDFADQVQAAIGGISPPVPQHIAVERVDESAERVVALKAQLNMFDEVVGEESSLIATVGSVEDRDAALDMARQSIVLVKNNDDCLPTPKASNLKVHVTGPTSDSLAYQSGGWTINWQGSSSDEYFTYGTTVLQAAKRVTNWDVTHSCGVSILGRDDCKEDDDANPTAIISADYVFLCIGEENYTEKPGDIRDLRLAQGQIDFVRRVKAETSGKLILIYFGGRPRLLHNLPEIADAIFISFLPGPNGGQAVMDLIIGTHNPSGRLPITYPKYPDGGGSPYFSAVSDQCTIGEGTLPHWDNQRCDTQWKFGHGLSYTAYTSKLTSIGDEIIYSPGPDGGSATKVKVKALVENTGLMAGSHSVLFFGFDKTRYVTPEYKRLVHFEKIYLEAGEEKEISWDLTLDDFGHIGPHDSTHTVFQAGMWMQIGLGADVDCRKTPDDSLCSSPILWTVEDNSIIYVGACHAACRLWDESGCSSFYGFDWDTCYDMCSNIAGENYPMNGRHEGWGWNYVNCIESVVRANVRNSAASEVASCPKMTTMCRDIFHTKLLDEYAQLPLGTSTTDMFLDVGVAFVAGIVAAVFTLSLFRKKRTGSRSENGHDVEFSPLPISTDGNGRSTANVNKIV